MSLSASDVEPELAETIEVTSSSDDDNDSTHSSVDDDESGTRDDSTMLRHLLWMFDGSISARGYFNGLNKRQAHRSLKHLQEEYNRYIREDVVNTPREDEEIFDGMNASIPPCITLVAHDIPASPVRDIGTNSDHERNSPTISAPPTRRSKRSHEQQLIELQVHWGKRHWREKFDLIDEYTGRTEMGPTTWSRHLTWLWSTLSLEYMGQLHGVLYQLRSTTSDLPNITLNRRTGGPRCRLQQTLIRDYHNIIRTEDAQDI